MLIVDSGRRRELAHKDHMFPHGPEPPVVSPPAHLSESATSSDAVTDSPTPSVLATEGTATTSSAPLIHSNCSGYFLEPVCIFRLLLNIQAPRVAIHLLIISFTPALFTNVNISRFMPASLTTEVHWLIFYVVRLDAELPR